MQGVDGLGDVRLQAEVAAEGWGGFGDRGLPASGGVGGGIDDEGESSK